MYSKSEKKSEKKRPKMVNITINIPHIYEQNIQKLIKLKRIPSRSEGIRLAVRDFLYNEYQNLKLLGYFGAISKKEIKAIKKKKNKQKFEKVEWDIPEINELTKKLGEKFEV